MTERRSGKAGLRARDPTPLSAFGRAARATAPPVGGASGGLDAHIHIRRSDAFTLDLELRIDPGRTMVLLGPNGAGKSTAVAALAGLLPVDAGHVTLAGRTLDDPLGNTFVAPNERRVGVVFQDYVLFPNLDVADNIAFAARSRGASRHSSRRAAQTWIDRLDLRGLERRRPAELSGGQAQRVALARALAREPDLLLLDEPLGALDVTTHNRLRRTLADHLATFGGPRLLITHNPADAFMLADSIQIIEEGRVTQTGTPDQIRHQPATPYVADVAGVNLLTGTTRDGTITLHGSSQVLHTADTHVTGPVLVTIQPRAIALYPEQPHGSPRNTWPTTIAGMEPLRDTVRVHLADPLALTVDITPEAARELHLHADSPIWATVKATEIDVTEQ